MGTNKLGTVNDMHCQYFSLRWIVVFPLLLDQTRLAQGPVFSHFFFFFWSSFLFFFSRKSSFVLKALFFFCMTFPSPVQTFWSSFHSWHFSWTKCKLWNPSVRVSMVCFTFWRTFSLWKADFVAFFLPPATSLSDKLFWFFFSFFTFFQTCQTAFRTIFIRNDSVSKFSFWSGAFALLSEVGLPLRNVLVVSERHVSPEPTHGPKFSLYFQPNKTQSAPPPENVLDSSFLFHFTWYVLLGISTPARRI